MASCVGSSRKPYRMSFSKSSLHREPSSIASYCFAATAFPDGSMSPGSNSSSEPEGPRANPSSSSCLAIPRLKRHIACTRASTAPSMAFSRPPSLAPSLLCRPTPACTSSGRVSAFSPHRRHRSHESRPQVCEGREYHARARRPRTPMPPNTPAVDSLTPYLGRQGGRIVLASPGGTNQSVRARAMLATRLRSSLVGMMLP